MYLFVEDATDIGDTQHGFSGAPGVVVMDKNDQGTVSGDQQELIVWCSDTEAATPLLNALGVCFSLDVQSVLPKLSERVTEVPTTKALLLYLSPVEILCRAMAAETPPNTALARWKGQAKEILGLNRQNRRRIQLLEIGTARANPDAFGARFQLSGTRISALEPQDEIFTLMAHRVLSDDFEARRFQAELEAASLRFSDGAATRSVVNLDKAFHAYCDLRQAHRRTQKEVELLQTQTSAAQEEIETLFQKRKVLEKNLRAAEKTREEAQLLQQQIRLMTQETDKLSAGHHALEQRLAQMSQGLESYEVQLSVLSAERGRQARRLDEKERCMVASGIALRELELQRDYLTTRLEQTQTELQRLRASKSFRLTAPLRRFRSLLSGKEPV